MCVCVCGPLQVPWVVAGTVRDNILFGSAYDSAWYKRVVRACALEEDISRLVAGDQTELGERGINVSIHNTHALQQNKATPDYHATSLNASPHQHIWRVLASVCVCVGVSVCVSVSAVVRRSEGSTGPGSRCLPSS